MSKHIKKALVYLAICVFLILSFNRMGIHCVFYKITGIPCPTCYMTRAIFSLIHGDISAYFNYNAMALPVGIVFLSEIFIDCFKNKNKVHIITTVILLINEGYYINRFLYLTNKLK